VDDAIEKRVCKESMRFSKRKLIFSPISMTKLLGARIPQGKCRLRFLQWPWGRHGRTGLSGGFRWRSLGDNGGTHRSAGPAAGGLSPRGHY
jgi:hypothetical protein